jgi:hypothetical protein
MGILNIEDKISALGKINPKIMADLTLMEKITVAGKTMGKIPFLYLDSAVHNFTVGENLVSKYDLARQKLPQDFDDFFMDQGDHYPPSQRLRNHALRVEVDSNSVTNTPNLDLEIFSMVVNFYNKLHTYQYMYKKGAETLKPNNA